MRGQKVVYILHAQKKIGFKMANVYANMFVNYKHMGCGYLGEGWKNVLKNCPEKLLSGEELPKNIMNIV
jgi:hypothetical protein